MPQIKSFRALRYQGHDLSAVVAPPYDVINDALRTELYARDRNNVIRLILGRAEDPYREAAEFLARGREAGVFRFDDRPAIYLLEQSYTAPDGKPRVRKGFIAACLLEPFGGSILPHEKTHSGPKQDRLELARATGTMFSQIFSLYSDPNRAVDARLDEVRLKPPDAHATFDGVENRLWVCTDESVILELAGRLRESKALIADGHHRYETALAYAAECRLRNPQHAGTEAYNFVPMYFANSHDPGTIVLPTHRIVHSLPKFDPEEFLLSAAEHFTLTEVRSEKELVREVNTVSPTFGLAMAGNGHLYVMQLRNPVIPSAPVTPITPATPIGQVSQVPPDAREPDALLSGVPPLLAGMDVVVLHEVVFKGLLGLTDKLQEAKAHLDYTRDPADAFAAVRLGSAQAAFFLSPPRLEQIRLAAEAGFVMPQKTTFFTPKLLSGLVMYSFSGVDA